MASFDPAQAARETAAELSAGWGVNNEPRVMSTLQALAKRAYAAGIEACVQELVERTSFIVSDSGDKMADFRAVLAQYAHNEWQAGKTAERNRTKQALAFIERGHRYDCDFYISRDTIPCTCGYEKARAVFQEETKPREVPE